jgi:antitoxin component of RelBE/YafQ-DinJ toxin-antitoxin module
MPAKKKLEGDTTTIAIRIGLDQYRQSTAIAALKGETVSEVVRDTIKQYIVDNGNLIGLMPEKVESAESAPYLDGPLLTGPPSAKTLEAMEELRAGRGHRAHSFKELMADLHNDLDD